MTDSTTNTTTATTTTATGDPVLISTNDHGVATVTLNVAHKHNAFDDNIIARLTAAFESLENDDSVKLLILAAHGKSFSAGGDLAWMKRMASYSYQDNLADAGALAQMLKTLNSLSKPTIARVQGAAIGGAVGLVSCCDIAVASDNAFFALSEVKVGLIPATISPYVIAAIGPRMARRYFLTAERFDAETARHLGLVNEVVEEARLDESIGAIVNSLLANAPQAVSAAKQLIADVAYRPINTELMNQTSASIAAARVSAEGQEGLSAFLEKRAPKWVLDKKG